MSEAGFEPSTVQPGAIARTLLGDDGSEPDRDVPCYVCGKQTTCPGFIWRSVKLWNREEAKLADANQRPAQFIAARDMKITCDGECKRTLFEDEHRQYQREIETTFAYLAMLRAGNFNPESLAWLRKHGRARDVEIYFKETRK